MSVEDPQSQWRRVSADLIVGMIDRVTEPGEREQLESLHCLGITDTPCLVEVEGVGATRVGPDVVRRHSPGDRLSVMVGAHMRAQWVLASASLIEQPALAFSRPSLSTLAKIRRALHQVARSRDPMQAEEITLEAFALASGDHAPSRAPPTAREARLVTAANEAMLSGYTEALRMRQVARDLGVSPSYLARAYRAQEGISMYERLTRLRIAAALARLASGARDLTALALDLGFSSHSHFAATFRRCVGASPRDYRLGSQI